MTHPTDPTHPTDATDWMELSARAALASHRLVGWTFFDPLAIERYTELGVPDGLGYYVNSRGAPLLPAGHQAVAAAFATIHPAFVQLCVETALQHTTVAAIIAAHDQAVGEGLRRHVPEIVDELGALADPLWAVADSLPSSGRVLFAAHRQLPRPTDPPLSAWLAVNCLREWRGDTHFAILVSEDIAAVEAGILDDAHRNYGGWIPRSRGADDAALATAFAALEARGLATDGAVDAAGLALRADIEARTDRLTARCWQALGEDLTRRFLAVVEPIGDRLVRRIDDTVGPQWMPAARDITTPSRPRGSPS
ncbi:MAG: SCO6745 family protein [Acidimicrobiales bacterium]